MKKLLLPLLVLFSLSACSVFERIGGYANDNPVIVDIATRQAVYRYVDAGESEQDKSTRAKQVLDASQVIDGYLAGNSTATVATLETVIYGYIDWPSLSRSDTILIQDIISLIKSGIESKAQAGLLDEAAVIGLRALLGTAINTAALL